MDDDSATEILEATYRALCRHGYADLTIEDIATETDRSESLVHYHYDSKENLFTEFLDFLYDRFTTQLTSTGGATPRERLFVPIETFAAEESAPGRELRTPMLAVTAQAPYDDAIQEELRTFDEFLFEHLREAIADGVDAGEFNERVDPTVAAEFLTTMITGAHVRQVTVDHSTERLSETVAQHAEAQLVEDETTEAVH
ncbi:TetR/AcrR family transcriptional regulator [Natrinema sp. 74]|uniref:TetR/AcrR family transcriptional regulator n=1 Tax=Natrinema sp. 74 TaxID=3384159 RepID=UPI0038D48693